MAESEGRHRRYCDGILKAQEEFFQANPIGPDLIDVQADAAIAVADQELTGLATVPDKGRFVVYDGTVYRIIDMWLEQGPTSDGREKWGVVIKKEAS